MNILINFKVYKDNFEQNYIVNLTPYLFFKICILLSIILGISFRIYHDGFNSNLLYPLWTVNTNIKLSNLIFFCLFFSFIGGLIGYYIGFVKLKYANYLGWIDEN